MPSNLTRRFSRLAERYPSLQFDPETGISKLDTDVLFDTGRATLSPESQQLLREYAEILRDPEAMQLRVMTVGHTDSRLIGKKPTREQFSDNWQLSLERARMVASFLAEAGVPDDRMGVAAFAAEQPVATNDSEEMRRLNRRVEIFLMGPQTPIVGWTETIPNVY
jgi:flagellar motor protein MotB